MKFCKQLLIQMICYYYYVTCTGDESGFITKEDKPYEPIKLKVPQDIWEKAFKLPGPEPTPVVRSHIKTPVTIVVPVHVPNDEDDYDESTTEAVAIEETTIQNDPIVDNTEVVNDTMVITTTTPEENVTTTTPKPSQVEGQLLRFPCSCKNGECGCCTGAILQRFNMKACGNISFIPEDFVFDVKLRINNSTVVHRRVSASDPPPVCFNPGVAPFVEVCAEISNIRIRNRNAYACLDIDANIAGFPIYSASFRCFGLGTKGVQSGLKPKPVKTKGPKPVNLFRGRSNMNNTTSTKQDSGLKVSRIGLKSETFMTVESDPTASRSISLFSIPNSELHQDFSPKEIQSDLKPIKTKGLKAVSAIGSRKYSSIHTSTIPTTSIQSNTTIRTKIKLNQVVTAKRIESGLKPKSVQTKGLKTGSIIGGMNLSTSTSNTPSIPTSAAFNTFMTNNPTREQNNDLDTKIILTGLKPIKYNKAPRLSRTRKSNGGQPDDFSSGIFEESEFLGELYDGRYL